MAGDVMDIHFLRAYRRPLAITNRDHFNSLKPQNLMITSLVPNGWNSLSPPTRGRYFVRIDESYLFT
jgi:hypothetical protein